MDEAITVINWCQGTLEELKRLGTRDKG